MLIRRANEADIPAMAELWAMLAKEDYPDSAPDTVMWGELQRRFMRRAPGYFAYVTKDSALVTGFCSGHVTTCLLFGERYLEASYIYVLPQYRKGTTGMMLFRVGQETARDLGAKFQRRNVSLGNERMMRRVSLARPGHIVRSIVVDESF